MPRALLMNVKGADIQMQENLVGLIGESVWRNWKKIKRFLYSGAA